MALVQNIANVRRDMVSASENPKQRNGKAFNLEQFLADHSVQVLKKIVISTGTKYQLEECPFDSTHRNGDAAVFAYLCRKNGIWQIARYNEYRELRLDSPVYSLSTLNVNSDDGDFQRARNDAENNAIPELGRYGIYLTEEDIRHPA